MGKGIRGWERKGERRGQKREGGGGGGILSDMTKRFHGCCYRLVGLVVKASASRAEGHGFESRWSRDFFGVKSYQ